MSTPDWRYYCKGQDGKVYPRRALRRELGWEPVGRAHYLHHHDRLSLRQIAVTIGEDYGIRPPSVGAVHAWLREQCVECSGGQKSPPEQSGGG